MGLSKLTINLMLVTLFSLSLVTFAILFGNDNNGSINLGDDVDFNNSQSNAISDVAVFYTQSNVSYEAFQKSTIQSQTESSEGGTQFKATPSASLSQFKNAITTSFTKIFGSDSNFGVVFTALFAVLGIIISIAAWAAWKGGRI